jgi:hypothetical protein
LKRHTHQEYAVSSSLNRTSGPRVCASPPRRLSFAPVAIVLATTLTAIAVVCLAVRAIPPRPAPASPVGLPDPTPVVTLLPSPRLLTEPGPVILRTHPALQEYPVLPPPAEEPVAAVVVRRQTADEETLVRQLSRVPEIELYTSFTAADVTRIEAKARKARAKGAATEPDPTLEEHGLTPLRGDDCKLTAYAAEHLEKGSVALRAQLTRRLSVSTPVPASIPATRQSLREALEDATESAKWMRPEAIPTLMQMMMAEGRETREVLIDTLARIDGPRATAALASRAVMDLDPGCRDRAVRWLEQRPAEQYLPTLLTAIRYPWLPIAEHAAEALAILKPKGAAAALVGMMDAPDPAAPFIKPDTGVQVVREVVRINHLRGCLMCHAPSTHTADKVRASVPQTDQPLRPYYSGPGLFVRADVTYLRQDFSLPLAIQNPGQWPVNQRFDFLVRERTPTLADHQRARSEGTTPHQKALFFALRGVTGKDPGPAAADWRKLYLDRALTPVLVNNGFTDAVGLAVSDVGEVFVAEPYEVLRSKAGEAPKGWYMSSSKLRGVALDGKGGLLTAFDRAARLQRLDLASKERDFVGDGDAVLSDPRRPAPDSHGGAYVCDADGKLHYVSSSGTLTALPVPLRVRAVALAAGGSALYVASDDEVWGCAVEAAGTLGPARRVAKVAGIADLAVGRGEVVCVAHPGGVAVYSPEGLRLAKAGLAEQPAALAVRGTTLHVLSRKSLYEVDLSEVARP